MKRGRNQRRRQGVNPNRALDSNGPEVRIRGTAQQIYDKYLTLARDATSSGDRVKAENYYQHAEHYFRVLRSVQGAATPQQDNNSTDDDFDSDQPVLGEGRDQRDHRDQGGASQQTNGGGVETDVKGDPESAVEQAVSTKNGEDRPSGDNETRKPRRRRPRRPQRDEATSGDDQEAVAEPASAS